MSDSRESIRLNRLAEATAYHRESMKRLKAPEPRTQKFPRGSRVTIDEDLGSMMSHFPSGCGATVDHTYAHAYGGDGVGVDSYCLVVDGHGQVAWYDEAQLSIEAGPLVAGRVS